MVAMLSFFCEAAEPLFNNCFSSANDGYDYLIFPNENRRKNASVYRKVSIANKCSVISIPQIINSSAGRIPGKISRTFSVSNIERLHKASSAPPLETFSVKEESVNGFLYSRQNSFNRLNIRRKSSANSSSRTRINCRGDGSVERKTSGFGRLLHFFESLNPLNGFKDKDDFEEYLYNRSNKIEPKNAEIPNPKPKHSLEALKSPGVRQQQKTPTSGNATSASSIHHRTCKNSTKSSVSSPRSPNQTGTMESNSGSGNLLSPSHMNVPFWSSPPSGSSTNSPASLMTTEEQNFAVVDINPGQFPRWLADTTSSGRVNPAFISEYVPNATAACLLHSALSHSSNESPPLSSSPGVNASTYPHKRKPPVPLCIGESHFTFPPPLTQQQNPQFSETFRKPPAPPPQQHQIIQHHQSSEESPSFLSPISAFTLAKPPSTRKKLPSEGSQSEDGEEKVPVDSPIELPPPKLPPRLNLLTNNKECQEAMAPPRPPKKVPLSTGKSPTCENQQQLSISSSTASTFETEANAPPLPPKPKGMKK